MSYQSPITMYTERIIKDINEKQDGYLIEEVRKVGFDINKEELAKALKYDRDQYMRGYTDGRMYKPTVITNADRIRAMSDEELAQFIWNRDIDIVEKTSIAGQFIFTVNREKCCKDLLDWLKEEVEE